MFWDKATRFYDFFEKMYTRDVFKDFPVTVA